jgi:hypothetical protein
MRFLETTELEDYTTTDGANFTANVDHEKYYFEDVYFEISEIQEEFEDGFNGYTWEGVLSYNERKGTKRTANVSGTYNPDLMRIGKIEMEDVEVWEEDMTEEDYKLLNQ